METLSLIYKAKNKINNKIYIGQTIQKLNERKSRHKSESFNKKSLRYTVYFHNALRKYGMDNFEWEIVWEGYCDKDKLDELESLYIDFFKSLRPNGYNLNLGGSGNRGFKHSEETKLKLSEYKGKNSSGYKYTIYEFYHPNYGIEKCTKYEFQEKYSINESMVSGLCLGRYKNASGWVLLKNKDEYDKIMDLYKFYHPEYGIEYVSQKELTNKYNLCINHVSELCLEKVKSHNGWVLLKNKDDYNNMLNIFDFYNIKYGIKTCTQSLLCKEFNLCSCGVSQLCLENTKQYKGWILLKNKDEYDKIMKLYTFYNEKMNITIKCSQAELRKKYNLQGSELSKICTHKRKTYNYWSCISIENEKCQIKYSIFQFVDNLNQDCVGLQ